MLLLVIRNALKLPLIPLKEQQKEILEMLQENSNGYKKRVKEKKVIVFISIKNLENLM